jgi:hypothetical protein
MAIRFEKRGNLYYPLPPDYPKLSLDGQRKARLNALTLQETPEDLVHAWAFFRSHYLEPTEAGWYKHWEPSPPMHYQIIHDMGKWSRNAYAAPRGFSKSTVLREAGMLLALTRPSFDELLVMCTIKKYRKAMEAIKWQFERNALINDDFTPLFGERLQPKRGQRPWGSEEMKLPNGSLIEGGSIESALRGGRPDFLIIDDPEYDEDEGTDQLKILGDFEKLLFKTLLPMLLKGSGLFWIGTLITRQSYLYTVTNGEDPRFKHFNRRVLTIEDPSGNPIWEERWDKQSIADLREMLGESAFQSEYMNNPGSASSRLLKIHPEFGWYTVDGQPEKEANPFYSTDPLYYKKMVKTATEIRVQDVTVPYGDWLSGLWRIATVDFIRKPSPHSDFACVGVYGFDESDTLWVLDMHLERVRGAPFIRKIFEMGMFWKVHLIGTEAVPVQDDIAHETAETIAEMASGTGWLPRVVPIRYARRHVKNTDTPTVVSKGERIGAMEARFNRCKIRFPAHRRKEFGISQLIHQIEYFTLDLSLLRHDDAVDTLAMHQYVPRRKGSGPRAHPSAETVSGHLAKGELVDKKTGIPFLGGADLSSLTSEVMTALRDRHAQKHPRPKEIPSWMKVNSPVGFW